MLQTVANAANRMSRAAVATATGLTRATVSALVDDLVAGSLLTEVEPSPRTGAGRPAMGLALSPDGPAGLGLEINVDYLAACVVDPTGVVRHRLVERADQRPFAGSLDGRLLDGSSDGRLREDSAGQAAAAASVARVGALAARVGELARADGLPLAGAALAVPGLVTGAGLVRVAPNLGWQDVDAVALLRAVPALADLPVTVDNEANLAALGELRADGGGTDFVYVSGEIGIGAGIVLDGSLYRGVRGWSGEIGHLPVYPDGLPCRCGSRGCLEQYAGQEAIAAHGPAGAAVALGIALASVVNLLDVDTIVLGGGYAPLLNELRPGIEGELRQRVLTADLAPVTLRAATLGADAAMRGAADSVIRAVQADPAAWLSRVAARI